MSIPQPMPVISRNVPAFTNDDYSGAFPASNANDSSYGGQHYWRCLTAPTGNADSGALTQAVYLAYDLSGASSGQRQTVVLAWYNDPTTSQYNPQLLATNSYNIPADYTIDTNTAAGGTLPTSGWTTKVTVTANPYSSRQHTIAMAGANWIRIRITAINGSALNNNAAINMDIHDASTGNDNWIFFGDSITAQGLNHDDINVTPGILPEQINASKAPYCPLMQDGGMGGYKASDAVSVFSTWLALFSGKYVGINFGTNDANAGGSDVATFSSNMTTMINAVIAAGKVPVIHKTIMYGKTSGILANGPTINTALASLFATFPQIIQGPDLWAYFQANQSLIDADNIHPTLYAGYIAYRQQWANALIANVYSASGQTVFRSRRRQFGTVM